MSICAGKNGAVECKKESTWRIERWLGTHIDRVETCDQHISQLLGPKGQNRVVSLHLVTAPVNQMPGGDVALQEDDGGD